MIKSALQVSPCMSGCRGTVESPDLRRNRTRPESMLNVRSVVLLRTTPYWTALSIRSVHRECSADFALRLGRDAGVVLRKIAQLKTGLLQLRLGACGAEVVPARVVQSIATDREADALCATSPSFVQSETVHSRDEDFRVVGSTALLPREPA